MSHDLEQYLRDHRFAALPPLDVRQSWADALEGALRAIQAEADVRLIDF